VLCGLVLVRRLLAGMDAYSNRVTPPSYRDTKVAKASVDYSQGILPRGARCLVCANFRNGGEAGRPDYGVCALVAGSIYAKMWCRLFEPGTSAQQRSGFGYAPQTRIQP